MLSHWTPKQHSEGRKVGTLPVWGQMQHGLGTLRASPLSLYPRTEWVSTIGLAAPRVASGLASDSPLFADMVGTFTLAACAGTWALVVTPRKSIPIPYGIWRNHLLPKESTKLHFSLSRVCERHLSPPPEPWEISMFSFTSWQYSWAIWLSPFLPTTSLLPLPVSASICDVGPPRLWLQDTTICCKMCATLLLRSPGLQFRAPVDMTEPMLLVISSSLGPIPGPFCWVMSLILLDWGRQLGTGPQGILSSIWIISFLLTASLCLFQTNEEDTWTVMLENVCFFYDTICKKIWF